MEGDEVMEDKLIQLFLQIINMSITASYVICAVLIIRFLLKKAPKKYAYALWSVVAFRLCCPVSFQSVFSLFSLKLFDMTKAQSRNSASLQYVPHNIGMMKQPEVTVGIPAVNSVISGSLPEATPMYSANPMQIWIAIGMYLWCMGMAVLMLYSVISYVSLKYCMWNAILLEGNVYQSDKVRSPFLLGIFRPKIYIPFGLDAQTYSYVLTHERYHLKRRDHVIKLLAFLLLIIHWFNPLCWLAFTLMIRDMEMSCDEKVLSGTENIRKEYSTTLLSFAENRRFPSPSPLAFGETGVKKRIKNVLNWKQPTLMVTLFAVVLCVGVLIACSANPKTEEKETLVASGKEQLQGNVSESLQLPHSEKDAGQTPWGDTTYCVEGIIYNAPVYNFSYTLTTAPNYHLTGDKKLLVQGDVLTGDISDASGGTWYELGRCDEFSLTEENFDVCFLANERSELGWSSTIRASEIRKDNTQAWQLFLEDKNVNVGFYILQQKDGTIYLAYGYHEGATGKDSADGALSSIRWLFRLREANLFQTYVSAECLYMSPLSSYLPTNGDSGCYYYINDNSFLIASKSSGAIASGVSPMTWEWQEFPYTEEVWKEMFDFGLGGGVDIGHYEERLYLELPDNYHLLKMDEELWVMRTGTHPNGEVFVWDVYVIEPQQESDKQQVAMQEVNAQEEMALETAIHKAIMEECKSPYAVAAIECEAHTIIATREYERYDEEQGRIIEAVDVYAMVLYEEYSYNNGGLEVVSGSHIPSVLSFEISGRGEYVLTNYWIPRDGSYYAEDIKKVFGQVSQEAVDNGLDTQKYIMAQKQRCYEQAVVALDIDVEAVIECLLESIVEKPLLSSNPQDHLDASGLAYRELLYYGSYTQAYIEKELAEGQQTDLRGQCMRLLKEELEEIQEAIWK